LNIRLKRLISDLIKTYYLELMNGEVIIKALAVISYSITKEELKTKNKKCIYIPKML